MENRNMQYTVPEKSSKRFWKNFGIGVLSFALALITIIVINL